MRWLKMPLNVFLDLNGRWSELYVPNGNFFLLLLFFAKKKNPRRLAKEANRGEFSSLIIFFVSFLVSAIISGGVRGSFLSTCRSLCPLYPETPGVMTPPCFCHRAERVGVQAFFHTLALRARQKPLPPFFFFSSSSSPTFFPLRLRKRAFPSSAPTVNRRPRPAQPRLPASAQELLATCRRKKACMCARACGTL